ncbi:uncharacterized protein LOC144608997 [Rhinoraja longicauda]
MSNEAEPAADHKEILAPQYTATEAKFQEMVKSTSDSPPIVEDSMDRRGRKRRMSNEAEPAADQEEILAPQYTATEAKFQEIVKSTSDPPPIVEDSMDRPGGKRRTSSEAELAPDYEEMFAHRFTAADTEYQEMVKSVSDLPPIVEDWMGRSGGNRRSRDYGFHREHSDNRHWSNNQPWQGRDRSCNRSDSYESYSQGSNSHWHSNHHRY